MRAGLLAVALGVAACGGMTVAQTGSSTSTSITTANGSSASTIVPIDAEAADASDACPPDVACNCTYHPDDGGVYVCDGLSLPTCPVNVTAQGCTGIGAGCFDCWGVGGAVCSCLDGGNYEYPWCTLTGQPCNGPTPDTGCPTGEHLCEVGCPDNACLADDVACPPPPYCTR